jgi:hypothetical protein
VIRKTVLSRDEKERDGSDLVARNIKVAKTRQKLKVVFNGKQESNN